MKYIKRYKKHCSASAVLFLLSVLYSFSLAGCSSNEKDTEILLSGNWINISTEAINFTYEGGTEKRSFTLDKETDLSLVSCSFSDDGDEWLTATIENSKLILLAEYSYREQKRSTTLTLTYGTQGNCKINVTQSAAPTSADKLIKIVGGEATSEEASSKDGDGNPLTLNMTWDGNKKTYFNSKFGAVSYPFYITYELEGGSTLNSIVYTPRTDSGNKWGSFDKFSVEVSTSDRPDEFTEVGKYERGNGVHTPFTMKLSNGIAHAKKVRFVINKAYEDRVSCAEMEFFEASTHKFDPYSIFADVMCTQLKPGVTEKQIKQIPNEYLKELGLALLNGDYDTSYRLAGYRPYQHPSIMAAANKTGKYSLRDNPTGIYAKSGEKLAVLVGKIYKGGKISLIIQDLNGGYNNFKTYELEEGYNEITAEVGGLIYVLNHVDDAIPLILDEADGTARKLVEEKTVQIHFAMGRVNGYFDIAKNKEGDWTTIRDNATYQDIDVLGKYSHITWRVSDFKKYNTEITRTVENCDRLVYLEEEFMGLVKYNRMFNNRMHFCIDYKAKSPNATDYRTVYNASDYYAEPFCNPDRFADRCWGPAHEVGHCNQTRPGIKWSGTTEVTNNIHSLYVQTSFGKPCKLLVDSCTPKDENGQAINGSFENIYEAAIAFIVNGKRAHSLPGVTDIVRETQLVPFWQLKLYMHNVRYESDFYYDLYEYFRTHESPSDKGENQGLNQLDFVRQACAISRINLLDFFERWGFLTPVDTELNDYGNKKFTITQGQIDALKAEINGKGYEPAPANLHLITEDNLNNY
ncbi:M60 family metallopeptidase [Bacteroides congonensis]|uniref:M60 family metallopeptidase n=1 Tax=Bacteroides congonensis TaxID=1871006 RepID=UPI0025A3D7B6|nr:M60 family metallopeptidase [Bacteroides congonensis]